MGFTESVARARSCPRVRLTGQADICAWKSKPKGQLLVEGKHFLLQPVPRNLRMHPMGMQLTEYFLFWSAGIVEMPSVEYNKQYQVWKTGFWCCNKLLANIPFSVFLTVCLFQSWLDLVNTGAYVIASRAVIILGLVNGILFHFVAALTVNVRMHTCLI